MGGSIPVFDGKSGNLRPASVSLRLPPDFLWGLVGIVEADAAFLNESRTRGRIQASVQEIRVRQFCLVSDAKV
jgi:hypothetical protein